MLFLAVYTASDSRYFRLLCWSAVDRKWHVPIYNSTCEILAFCWIIMAGRDSVHARSTNIVSELFSRLNENAISPQLVSFYSKVRMSRLFSTVKFHKVCNLAVISLNYLHKTPGYFTLSNARRFYSSKESLWVGKG